MGRPTVPALAADAASSLAPMAGPLQTLTAAPRLLGSLLTAVQSLDREVKLMRAAVEDVRTEVQGVKASVAPLEDQLVELQRSLHPIGRLTGKLRRGEGEPQGDQPDSA
jgi:phage shock protein A